MSANAANIRPNLNLLDLSGLVQRLAPYQRFSPLLISTSFYIPFVLMYASHVCRHDGSDGITDGLAEYLQNSWHKLMSKLAKKVRDNHIQIEDEIIANHLIAGRWIIPAAYMLAHVTRQLPERVAVDKHA